MGKTDSDIRKKRYRLEFINENTYNRLWSVRMSRRKVVVVCIAVLAAVSALIFVSVAYTPLRRILPGSISGDVRAGYIQATVRLDSIEEARRVERAWLDNLRAILQDSVPQTSSASQLDNPASDSLLAASEAERDFLRRYEDEERYRLSVLAPIAAEGMVFVTPVDASARVSQRPDGALSVIAGRPLPVTAVYRGTVAGVYTAADGTSSIVVQHPNDFISVYSGVGELYTRRGAKVTAGQRIAQTSSSGMSFELWHGGTLLDAREYIPF